MAERRMGGRVACLLFTHSRCYQQVGANTTDAGVKKDKEGAFFGRPDFVTDPSLIFRGGGGKRFKGSNGYSG